MYIQLNIFRKIFRELMTVEIIACANFATPDFTLNFLIFLEILSQSSQVSHFSICSLFVFSKAKNSRER